MATSRASTGRIDAHLKISNLEDRVVPTVGGGFLDAGVRGEYFANPDLAGDPSFARSDVRIDFDWGTSLAPGGSLSPDYQGVGTDDYSIRWAGRVSPRFSETYTLHAVTDDGVRVLLRPAGSGTWETVIDDWAPGDRREVTGTYDFAAGEAYDIRVEYRELAGAAGVSLAWSSDSTPREVIEPAAANAYHVDSRSLFMFADAVKSARSEWSGIDGNPRPALDETGSPTGDGALVVWEGAPDEYFGGTYAVRFGGQADVSAWPGSVRFQLPGDDTLHRRLDAGLGYDLETNTTEFRLVVEGGQYNSPFQFSFRNTKRQPTDQPGTGITGLEVMRPRTVGGDDPYEFGTIYTDAFKDAAGVFTGYRWLDVNGDLTESAWSDRALPGNDLGAGRKGLGRKGWVYEYQIMFANETGKDLYVTTPMRADNDYFANLARLIKYGSRADGTPAGGPDDPLRVFPGLNPNLKVYVEVSNEVWNFAGAFGQTRQADDDAVAAGLSEPGTPARAEWDIINYDNTLNTDDAQGYDSFNFKRLGRWYALRTVRMSEEFRGVYGDAMIDAVRPVLYWQYNNANNTAMNALKFLDDYFNNGDGRQHVADPKPLNHYLWGAGGASYFGSGNPTGALEDNPVPPPASWSYAGDAGTYTAATSDYYDPPSGGTAAYLKRGGSMQTQVTFTESGRYAIGFKARGTYDIPLDFFVNGERVTPRYEAWRGVGEADAADGPRNFPYAWNLNFGAGWDDLTTATLDVDVPEGGSRTVTLSIAASPITAQPGDWNYESQIADYMLFDEFYVGSVDAIFAAGIPDRGQANGQVGTGDWARDRKEIAQYARAYGLEPASYESGWSLGGDHGASPLQNWAKYRDPRARAANLEAIRIHELAGYALVAHGVYEQWRDWDLADAAGSELRKGFEDANDRLPELPANGVPVPQTLTRGNHTLAYVGSGSDWRYDRNAGGDLSEGEWMMWNVVVPRTGDYRIVATTTVGGAARLSLDESTVAEGPGGPELAGTVYLTAGLHTVKLRSTDGTVGLERIEVVGADAPDAPTLTAAEGDGSATLTWTAVPGATSYRLRWGTAPGMYTESAEVGGATAFVLNGLTNGTAYYVAVGAANENGEGMPSAERTVLPLADGQVGALAMWEFTGYDGDEANAPPTAAASRLTVGPVTRGPGLQPSSGWVKQWFPNRFSAHAGDNDFADTLAESIEQQEYYELTVAPAAGRVATLTGLKFQAWFSDADAAGVGVLVSADGENFVEVPASGSPNGTYTVDLTGVAGFQDFAGPVTVRLHLFADQIYTATGIGLGTPADDMVITGSTRAADGLPAGWAAADLGTPAVAGSTEYENGVWAVTGSGRDFRTRLSEYHFASAEAAGDLTLTARVDDFDARRRRATAGLMVRDGLGEDAVFAAVVVRPNGRVAFYWRSALDQRPEWSRGWAGDAGSVKWLRLVRHGDGFTAYYAGDDGVWQRVGRAAHVPMPETVRAGLAVTSLDDEAATAVFTGVTLEETIPEGPIDVTHGGTASGSGIANADYAFDGRPRSAWRDRDAESVWLQYDFGEGRRVAVSGYALRAARGPAPATWQLLASDDGENWAEVDQRGGEAFGGESRFFAVDQPEAHRYYRIAVTADDRGRGDVFARIDEFTLFAG